MQKNKYEKVILSAPKTAATLIIAATLNTAPTVIRYTYIHIYNKQRLHETSYKTANAPLGSFSGLDVLENGKCSQ